VCYDIESFPKSFVDLGFHVFHAEKFSNIYTTSLDLLKFLKLENTYSSCITTEIWGESLYDVLNIYTIDLENALEKAIMSSQERFIFKLIAFLVLAPSIKKPIYSEEFLDFCEDIIVTDSSLPDFFYEHELLESRIDDHLFEKVKKQSRIGKLLIYFPI
jgi:hypothetical protein